MRGSASKLSASSERHDLSGALDRRVGAFHGFDGHARRLGDHHGLANIVAALVSRYRASIFDILFFLSVGPRWVARRAWPAKARAKLSNFPA